MRAAILGALMVALTGCSLIPGTTVRQNVPVPVPCNLPEVALPAVPLDSLPPAPDVFVTGRALWASIEVLEGDNAKLRAAMEGCRAEK